MDCSPPSFHTSISFFFLISVCPSTRDISLGEISRRWQAWIRTGGHLTCFCSRIFLEGSPGFSPARTCGHTWWCSLLAPHMFTCPVRLGILRPQSNLTLDRIPSSPTPGFLFTDTSGVSLAANFVKENFLLLQRLVSPFTSNKLPGKRLQSES